MAATRGTAEDRERARAFFADEFVFEDRRRWSLVRGGYDEWFRSLQFLSTLDNASTEVRLVAIAGDRLALREMQWETRGDGAHAALGGFTVSEIDEHGKLVSMVLFDAEQRSTAHAELFERYVRLGADGMHPAQIEWLRAVAARDPARMRAALPDSSWVHDHRRLGLGRLERDAYVASFIALNELSRELRIDELHQVAVSPRARLVVSRVAGVNAEGGEFEMFAVALSHVENGRLVSSEYFDLEDLAAARARFEALNSDERR